MNATTFVGFCTVIAALFATLVGKALACEDYRLSYETCKTSSQCYSLSFDQFICAGRNSLGTLLECPDPQAEHCVCRPRHPHICDTNNDCLDGEYCATSKKSGASLCIGCLALQDERVLNAFDAVNATDTDERCPKSHPPCGHMDDFCSVSMPCDDKYKCLTSAGGNLYECSSESTSCRCFPKDDPRSEPLCTKDEDCPDPREVCATHTLSNKSYCTSCDVVRDSFDIKPNRRSKKCQRLDRERQPPQHYVEGPNGRAMDRCLTKKQCTGGSNCFTEVRKKKQRVLESCLGDSDKLCFCRKEVLTDCSKAADCEVGESCMRARAFGIKKNCVSNALFDVLSGDSYKVIGKRRPSPTDGTKLSGETCRFDWQCKGPRRCTHLADNEKANSFGRCAGREACQCKPLTTPPCTKHSDCDTGEQCVTVIDAKFDPFCLSAEVLRDSIRESGDYVPYNSPLLSPATPSPVLVKDSRLNDEPCSKSRDCKKSDGVPRKCYFKFEEPNEFVQPCDGKRRNCICKVPFTAYPKGSCKLSKECPKGEVCVLYLQQVPKRGRCVSEKVFSNGKIPYQKLGSRSIEEEPSQTPEPSEDNEDGDDSEDEDSDENDSENS